MRGIGTILLLLTAGQAQATFIKPLIKETIGTGGYRSTYLSVDVGNDLHFKPYFSTYRSNTSSGTYNTIALRGSYEFDAFGVSLFLGYTPTVNNYNNRFAGGDFTYTYDFDDGTGDKKLDEPEPGPATKRKSRGISYIDVGAGITSTLHREFVAFPGIVVGKFVLPTSTGTVDIQQTDLNWNTAVGVWDFVASLDVTKSVYNKDVGKLGTTSAQVDFLPGLSSTVQGFPDLNVNIQLEYDGTKKWSPYVGYTYTQYKVSQPIGGSYTGGVYVDLPKSIVLNGSYQRYTQKGAGDLNFLTLSARMRF